MKRMIFHIPQYIEKGKAVGSQIRPIAMLEAFQAIGYEVDVVMGHGNERKKQINEIKRKIKNGQTYEFLYSESSTMPTLLTEKHHLPTFPFLDFNFFYFAKKHGIKIGLFYRDVYWRFDYYKEVPLFKRLLSISMYKYDLIKYNQLVDILYLPTKKMYKYIPFQFKGEVKELPPAIQYANVQAPHITPDPSKLHIFYVGGVSKGLYNIDKLVEAISQTEHVSLTICTRKNEWEREKDAYEPFMNDRIEVIHKSGDDLIPYYQKADLLSLFMEPVEYRSFAMPVKLFEYIGYLKPIIATKETAVADFIETSHIGWTFDYSAEDLHEFFVYINNHREELQDIQDNMKTIVKDHTWKARAQQVERELSK